MLDGFYKIVRSAYIQVTVTREHDGLYLHPILNRSLDYLPHGQFLLLSPAGAVDCFQVLLQELMLILSKCRSPDSKNPCISQGSARRFDDK